MKSLFLIACTLCLAAPALAQDAAGIKRKMPFADHSEKDAGAVPQGRAPGCGCEEGGKCGCQVCLCDGSYKGAYYLSLKSGLPLVVFIGQPARAVEGAVVHANKDAFPQDRAKVWVGSPNKDAKEIVGFALEGAATDRQILAAADRAKDSLRPQVGGYFTTARRQPTVSDEGGTDSPRIPDVPPAIVQTYQRSAYQPTYQPAYQSFQPYMGGYSSGGCANGSCGTSSAGGRRR